MLMLYAAVIDDAEDIKKFEKIYYEYREQMFFCRKQDTARFIRSGGRGAECTAGDSAQHKDAAG